MSTEKDTNSDQEEDKSQARLDYEQGQEFMANKNLSQAANAFHNALLGFQEEKDQHGIANAADKLGDICREGKEYEKALTHFDTAYQICEKDFDQDSVFSIVKKRAAIAWEMKDYDKAIEQYLDILDEYNGQINPQGSVETLETMATIYLEMGDKAKAADAYRVVASIHKNFNHPNFADRFLKKAEETEAG